MSDELERVLRDVRARVPSPDPAITRRVRERVLGFRVARRRRISVGVVGALLVGMAIGYWAIPQEEHAIGAADPPQVSIAVNPTVFKQWTPVDVAGRIVAEKAGEYVGLEENLCGRGWTASTGARTNARGEFGIALTSVSSPQANGLLRARWGNHVSNAVRVAVRPSVALRQRGRRGFEVIVVSFRSIEGRTAQLERYDRSSNQWRIAARAKLRSAGYANSTEARLRANLPKGTIVRGVVSATQARPCNIAGYSNMMTVAG